MITKVCSKCRQRKSAPEFYAENRTRDGLAAYCKECHKEYKRKSGKSWYRDYGGKEYMKEYATREEFREAKRQYAESEKGKLALKKRQAVYYQRYRVKINARGRVSRAIRTGKMPSPTTLPCTYCKKQAEQYHHLTYNPWDNVIPLCSDCHRELHRTIPK